MKTIVLSAAAAAALFAATPVLAEAPARILGVDDYYASLGYTQWDAVADVEGVTGRLGARFNDYFGVEGEASFGMSEDRWNSTTVANLENQYGVFAVGFVPVAEKIDLIGRVGYTSTTQSVSSTGFKDDTDTGFNYGVGAQYFVTDKVAVRADWTRTDFRDKDEDSADAVTLSLVGKF